MLQDLISLIDDPWFARGACASLVISMLFAVSRSGSQGMQKCGLWMLVSWIGSNVIFTMAGRAHAPWLIAPFNAMIVLQIWRNAAKYHCCRLGPWIVALYCVEFAVTGSAFTAEGFDARWLASGGYYAVLNSIFVLRIVTAWRLSYVEARVRGREFFPLPHSRAPGVCASVATGGARCWTKNG
jgi:hypothetical protein